MPAHRKPVGEVRRPKTPPGFRLLPHAGRSGDPPAWPLSAANAAEKQKWAKVWTLPQAVEWERMRCEDEVAVYVRVFVRAMKDPEPKMLNELRQLDAKIGLSPRAMLDLRWETDEAVLEEAAAEEAEVFSYVPDP